MMFQIGDELRIPLGQQRRTVLVVSEGRAQFDIATGSAFKALVWYDFAALEALNPRPVQTFALTAADTWDGDPANTTAPADENSYPRKPFTVVRLPAEKLQVGDVLIGGWDDTFEQPLTVVSIQKLVGNTAARHFTFDEGGNRYGEQVFNRKWYQVKRSAA